MAARDALFHSRLVDREYRNPIRINKHPHMQLLRRWASFAMFRGYIQRMAAEEDVRRAIAIQILVLKPWQMVP